MRIVDLLERGVRLHADRTAVVVVDGPSLTYRELGDRVRRVATGLAERGVGRGDRVVLMARNGVVYFDVYLAVAYLGAAAVPVNTTLADDQARFIIGDAEPTLAVADGEHAARLAALLPPDRVVATSSPDWDVICASQPWTTDVADESDTALVMYTSGTTGHPKGVCLTQRGLVFNGLTMAIAQEFRPTDVFLSSTPLYHAATGTRITSMLVDGQTHVVMPRFDVDRCVQAIEEHRVTIVVWVPVQLRRILDSPARDDHDLSSLRLVVYGAAPTERPLIERAHAELGCGLYQGYGLTEAVTNLTALTPADHDRAMSSAPELLASCGRPVPGVGIEIRDGDGAPLPDGEIGEIYVRTEKVMAGYWRQPDATAEAIVDGWLRTGDLGRTDAEGHVFISGRAKDMLISGGVNVYPSEIEAVLYDHPHVADAAVVGVPDAEWGEVPVAFVVPAGDHSPNPEDLRAHCGARLAKREVPREVRLVADLPRTATGKVRKVELRDRFSSPQASG